MKRFLFFRFDYKFICISQEEPDQYLEFEPVITDLDRLVDSVRRTASSRSEEDEARLERF